MYEFGQIIKIEIMKARVRLLRQKRGIVIVFNQVAGHVIILECTLYITNSYTSMKISFIFLVKLVHFLRNIVSLC